MPRQLENDGNWSEVSPPKKKKTKKSKVKASQLITVQGVDPIEDGEQNFVEAIPDAPETDEIGLEQKKLKKKKKKKIRSKDNIFAQSKESLM